MMFTSLKQRWHTDQRQSMTGSLARTHTHKRMHSENKDVTLKKAGEMWHKRKDLQMRCRGNRWKQKRETADAECKVGAVQSRQYRQASPAERNEFPHRAPGSVMEMGARQPQRLTVNRILVRHTASGEAQGSWQVGLQRSHGALTRLQPAQTTTPE